MLPIIKKELILFDLEAADKEAVLQQMTEKIDQGGYLLDLDVYYQDVAAREAVFSTFIGYDIGLPHGKSDGVREAGICVARLKNSVVWNAETGDEVKLVIMIAVKNQEGNNLHLQILSKLSRMLMHEEFRHILLKEGTDLVFDTLVETLEV
mgnify:CR=1 FL=1